MFWFGKYLVKNKGGIYNEYNNDLNNLRSYCYRKGMDNLFKMLFLLIFWSKFKRIWND